MPRRFYVSPMEEAMSVGGQMAWAPRIMHMARTRPSTSCRTVSSGPAGGWGLVAVETPNHVDLLADSTTDALPDITLDSPLSILSVLDRNRLINRLSARGIDTSTWGLLTPFRTVLAAVGTVHLPGFDPDTFTATL